LGRKVWRFHLLTLAGAGAPRAKFIFAEEPRSVGGGSKRASIDKDEGEDIILSLPVFTSHEDIYSHRNTLRNPGSSRDELFNCLAEEHGQKVGELAGFHMSTFLMRKNWPVWWPKPLHDLNNALLDKKKVEKDLVTTMKNGMFYITHVFVDPEHRGRDLGLKLVADTMLHVMEHISCCALLPFPGDIFRASNSYAGRGEHELAMAKLGSYFSKIGFRQCGREYPQAQFWMVTNKKGKDFKVVNAEKVPLDAVSRAYDPPASATPPLDFFRLSQMGLMDLLELTSSRK